MRRRAAVYNWTDEDQQQQKETTKLSGVRVQEVESSGTWVSGGLSYGISVFLAVVGVVLGSVALGMVVHHNNQHDEGFEPPPAPPGPAGSNGFSSEELERLEAALSATPLAMQTMMGVQATANFNENAGSSPQHVNEAIRQCILDVDNQELVSETTTFGIQTVAENFTWVLPLYVDLELLNEKNALIMPGFHEGFSWFAPGIPSEYEEGRYNDSTSGLPTQPDAPFPPFFNLRTFADFGHKKWWAAPSWALPFLGQDFRTHQSASAENSIFVKNLEDRDPQNKGVTNQLKRVYMSALTCDKMPLYEGRLTSALRNFRRDVVVKKKPILSSWFDRVLLEFFIGLHAGTDSYPDYVTEYYRDFMTLLSDTNRSTFGLNDVSVLVNHCRYPQVFKYFEERRRIIVASQDTSTLTYWWALGGMPDESLVFECIHNILAFVQYVTIVFATVRARTPYQYTGAPPTAFVGGGYQTISNLYTLNPAGSPVDFPFPNRDFIADYHAASTDEEKFNVLRETYRILLPNNFWFSRPTETAANEAAKDNHEQGMRGGTGHIPLVIQTINDGWNKATGASEASTYSTARYGDFATGFTKCPHLNAIKPEDTANPSEYPDNLFEMAAEDGETLVPKSHKEYIPVYEKGNRSQTVINGPKYCPFGLGYRRCPGELMNMWVLRGIFEELKDWTFKMDPPMDLMLAQPSPGDPRFETAIPLGPLGRAMDNLYVDTAPPGNSP